MKTNLLNKGMEGLLDLLSFDVQFNEDFHRYNLDGYTFTEFANEYLNDKYEYTWEQVVRLRYAWDTTWSEYSKIPELTWEVYFELLAEYKSTGSRRQFLTRSRKQCEEHLEDQKRSYNGVGWLHGERVKLSDVRETERGGISGRR